MSKTPPCPTEFDEQAANCPCGCGAITNRAPRNDTTKKWVKGEPLYKKGHNHKTKMRYLDKMGRVTIPGNGHKNGRGRGCQIFEHTAVATSVLGRPLKAKEQVHHVNGNPGDNRNENLVICGSYGYHALLHQRERALKECGNPNKRKCVRCKKYDLVNNLLNHGKGCYVHEKCRKNYKKQWYERTRTNRI